MEFHGMEPNAIIFGSFLLVLIGMVGFYIYKTAYKNPSITLAEEQFNVSRTSSALSDRINALESLVRQGMTQAQTAEVTAHEAKSISKDVRDTLNGKISGISRKQSELESQFSGLAYHIIGQAQQQEPTIPQVPGQTALFDPQTSVR